MQKPKMIISDIDGTLTNQDDIPRSILREISRIQSLGVYFTFATGRPLMMVEKILRNFKMNCPIVINSGVEIYNQSEDNLMILDEFEKNWVKRVIDYFQCQKIGVRLVKQREIITDLNLLDKKNDIVYKMYGKNFKQLNNSLLGATSKLNFFLRKKVKIDLVLDYFEKEKGVNVSVNKSNNRFIFIDVLPKNAGKRCAIKKVQQVYRLTPSDCIVLANDMNDLGLIQTADFVVAPQDASPIVREKANLIVSNLAKNGMLNFLKSIK